MNDPYLVIYQTLDFRADLKSKMALAMVQSIYLSPMGVACKQLIPADSFMDWRNVTLCMEEALLYLILVYILIYRC
jgi:hypothetical protein